MSPWYSLKWFTINQLREFSWVHSYYLYAILFIPIVLWLRVFFHGRAAQKLLLSFGNQYAIRTWSAWLRWLYPMAVFGMLMCILFALARPQIIKNIAEDDAEAIDIVLAIDISESMADTDFKPSRLAVAKTLAQKFVKGRLNDRIGLVIFAGEAFTFCPLTTDYDLLNELIAETKHDLVKTSGTAIGSALGICINRLRESEARSKVVVLLSDGENTAGNLDPVVVAKLAKAFNIKVYSVGMGRQNETDFVTLNTIAKTTKGSFYKANDYDALHLIFNEIDRLERVKVKKRFVKDMQDFYRIYLYWAITFMLVALALKTVFIANVLED